MIGSDGTLSDGQGHPRAAGAFPRVLGRYVRAGRLTLSDAIARMTALPAKQLGLTRKGTLRVGADADIVIFDPDTILDRATFEAPLVSPVGIDYVLIGGEIALDHGEVKRTDAGRAVRR